MEGEREAAFVKRMGQYRYLGLALVIITLLAVIALVVGFC